MNMRLSSMVLALVAVVAAGCGAREAQRGADSAVQSTPGEAADITIVGKDNVYEPAIVEIKTGQEYEFHFKNVGETVHNLIVQAKDQIGQDFQTDIVVNTKEESTFKVKIDREGTYPMICTYHPEMKGELKVTR